MRYHYIIIHALVFSCIAKGESKQINIYNPSGPVNIQGDQGTIGNDNNNNWNTVTESHNQHDRSSSEPEDAYWNNGNPSWDDLKRITRVGNREKIAPWYEGCYYCQAEMDSKTTMCWPQVNSAKSYGWKHGFIGYNRKDKVWCNPPTSAAHTAPHSKTDVNRFWLE